MAMMFFILFLTGCSRVSDLFNAADEGMASTAESYEMQRESPSPSGRGRKSAVPTDAGSPEEDAEMALAEPQPEQEQRKRIYSGYAFLLVDSIEEEKKKIGILAEDSGGYIESSYESSVVIRVPAGDFEKIFQRLLSFGEVISKSVETVDVTEAFRDLSTRLTVARKTRERLYSLLEKTDDVEERLQILREIRRLTEEIEAIGLRLTLLERQISFSRISIDLEARLANTDFSRDNIPFPWIAGLNPLHSSLRRLRGRISFDLGKGFAVIPNTRVYAAESADGVRARVGTTRNLPEGNTEFWQKALHHHLGGFYKTADLWQLGSINGVLFRSKDRTPFAYFVGITVHNRDIGIIEVFFPNVEAFDARWENIKNGLEGFRFK